MNEYQWINVNSSIKLRFGWLLLLLYLFLTYVLSVSMKKLFTEKFTINNHYFWFPRPVLNFLGRQQMTHFPACTSALSHRATMTLVSPQFLSGLVKRISPRTSTLLIPGLCKCTADVCRPPAPAHRKRQLRYRAPSGGRKQQQPRVSHMVQKLLPDWQIDWLVDWCFPDFFMVAWVSMKNKSSATTT